MRKKGGIVCLLEDQLEVEALNLGFQVVTPNL
jgi:hypothetical protein